MSVRRAFILGREQGLSARATVLDIVGKVNRKTGRRQGGIIGLTSKQSDTVARVKAGLSSGDPEQMRRYLALKLRDRRYDGRIRKAIKAGERLSKADVDLLTERYRGRLLGLRGSMIARTETHQAAHAASNEAMQQLVDTGSVRPQQVRKIWQRTPDSRVRDSHRELGGESIGFGESFISPATGARMLHPGDTSQGALAEDVIQCRCWMRHRIDFGANL